MSAPAEQRTDHSWFADRHPHRYALSDTCGLVLIAAVAAFLALSSPPTASAKEVKRVLILNVYGPLSSPGVALMDQAIVADLEKSPYQVELYSENLDAVLFPDEASQQLFRDWYIRKYRDRKPDVIITVGPEPLKFMVEVHENAFPNVPIIFFGSTEEMLDEMKLDSHFTGVWGVAEPEKTLKAALQLQPGTRHVVVVGGTGAYDRHLEAIAREAFHKYESSIEFTYLTDLDMPTLLERLRHLPDHTIVYHTSLMQDVAGTRFIDAVQSVPMIVNAANAPVFVVDDVDVGKGTVGGYVLSFAAQGRAAAEMAVKVLSGEKLESIPVVKSANIYMFDWRAMRHFGLKESNLPPGSMVLNREPTLWEAYRRYILGALVLILLEALLIFGLLWQRARRRRVETELATAHDRLMGVFGSAMDAIIAVDSEQRILLFNTAAEKIFGFRAEEAIGTSIQRFIPDQFRIADNAHIHLFGQTDISNWVKGTLALRGLRATGEEFPIETSISQVGTAEKKVFTAIIRDITERNRAEQAIRESEERFRLVANTAPVLIWMSGPDKLCTYFNQPWLEFTGRPVEAELGNGWADGVHPEDLSACMDTYTNAFDRRESFKMQYRLRRNDGEYRWVFDLGVPRFNPDRSIAGYIGSCIDVTDRKMAEEALAGLTGRLIETQEEERRRIAREIHDDYNQRLAVLANELEDLAHSLGDSVAEAGPRLHNLWTSVSELGVDLHSLSHRLHSSTLETLGLVAGVRAFCEEFGELQQIEVEFTHENIPWVISTDVSLCLFRIAQEALRNVKRHSGASRAEVHVEFLGGRLHLSVGDQGRGFNPSNRSEREGIGIRSMEERLHFFGGQLEIHSQPMAGTRIDAWVPFKVFG